ncbi:GAF domain-containing protein [Candidatus Leptofilum sp.]|uniref:GAF domain-containing protein n=1 Tax=Candidatus Leptofilum sp. TaxID=3241576 RepID=UPI003B59AACD
MSNIYPNPQETEAPVYKNDCLHAIFQAVRAGRCVRVLGPRFRTKSAHMLAAAQMLQEHGSHNVHYLSMKELPNLRQESFFVKLSTDLLLMSEADLYAGLYGRLQRELFPMDTPIPPEFMQTSREFCDAMETIIRRQDRPLALFIDNLNMAPPNVVLSLLNALADLYTAVSQTSGPQFQAIIGGALDLQSNSSVTPTRFLQLSDLVWIHDLDEAEREAFCLAACQRAAVMPNPHALEALFRQTGGDLFLIERILGLCLQQLKRRGQQTLTAPRLSEAIDNFLNNPTNDKVDEILQQVEGDTNLLFCTLSMLEHGSLPISQMPMSLSNFPNVLDLCGIFMREDDSYRLKNNIWGHLLQKHLNPAQVGGFYAVNGRWRHAFEYLGKALNEGQAHVRPSLYTAVLNAMHGSENAVGAFSSLAQGLTAAFPTSDLHLYAWQEGKLRLFFPEITDFNQQARLENPAGPEMRALNGANFTIVPVEEELRLLIPLRSELKPGTPIGLVSLGKLVSPNSPYQRQDEVLQLVGFLHQAAQIIEERARYANLLYMAEGRATTLNRLNSMLTEMLNHREWPESHILQLALNGITSPYGLDLNRAVVFMLNENEQCLQVPFAAGQLTQQDAEVERELWLQYPPETALTETAVSYSTSTMQTALKRLHLSLYAPAPDLLLHQLQSGEPLLSSSQLPRQGLPPIFAKAIGAPNEFALVPLTTGEHTFGILYVDNKFAPHPISPEQYELLQSFVSQVALVLENARALVVERQRTNSWRKLLEVEETLNNKVTDSIDGLLQTVVQSAQELFQADSAVVYPLQPSSGNGLYRYEPAKVQATGTLHAVQPTDKPRPAHGLASYILQQGFLAVGDVDTAVSSRLRLSLETSTFLPREGIRAFVGIRLGNTATPAGLLYLNWKRQHQLTAEQKTVLDVFANFVAIALPSARSYQQLEHNLTRRNLERKGIDQLFFSIATFRSDEAIENTILLALRRAQEYTTAPRVFLIRDEPKGAWGMYQLLSTGKVYTRQLDALPSGLIEKAFTSGTSQLQENGGPPETGEFRARFYPESRCGLAVPVKVTGNPLAVLYLESPKRYGLTKDHQRFMYSLTSRLAMNLEQADRNRALRELRDLSQRLADDVNLSQLLAAIISQALNALQAVDAITVYHQDPESARYLMTTVSSAQETAVVTPLPDEPSPLVKIAWELSQPKFVKRVEKNPQLRQVFPHQNQYLSTAVFPLEVGSSRVGCMFFGYEFHNQFSEADRGTLEQFAQLAALAILRAQLHIEAEQRQQRLDTVSRITPIISASVKIDLIFRNLMQEILSAFPKANNACIVEHLPDKDEVAITDNTQPFYNVDVPLLEDHTFRTQLSKRRGIAGRVLSTGELCNVEDVSQDMDYIPAISSTRSEIAVPIVIDDVVNYILVIESDELAAFSKADEKLLKTLAKHVALAVKNANQFSRSQALELTQQTAMMATGLVHDINNAVAAFPDLVDEIAYKYDKNRDISAPLANLQKSARATDKISGRLKDFVFTGAYRPETEDVHGLIQNAIDLSKPQKPPHVSIIKEIATDMPKIQADSLWIELLLKNLFVNAFAAIPTDRDGKVIIKAKTDETHLLLTVQDNGSGIPEALQQEVFNFGTSTKGDSLHKMHGVGLYHCQLIARAHGGTLELKSEPDQGTVFTLSLPLQSSTQHSPQEGLIDA